MRFRSVPLFVLGLVTLGLVARKTSHRRSPGRPPARVLVVDDDADAIFLLKRAFAHSAPELTITYQESGRAFLNSVENNGCTDRPDLILLDLHMPGVDGFEVLHYFKQHPSHRPACIIVFSCSNHPLDQTRAIELGADGYLVKPSGFAELCTMTKNIARVVCAQLPVNFAGNPSP